MDKRLYVTIIADIIGSKKINDRSGVQKQLEKVLEQINITYRHAIASQFIITLGDEFQGVLHDGSVALDVLDRIQREMHPITFRFGIGVGSISVRLQPVTSLGSDGTAFHLARSLIEEVRALETKKTEAKTNMLISIEDQESTSTLLNSMFKLIWALQENWTDRQRQIIATLQQYNETQAAIAKRLGIVQSSVQKSLAGSQYYTYKEASDTISQILRTIIEKSL
ncbi:MAG TPA: SatD family protein [Sphaerochaeta sp.]|nr:SatD family protein [Sphaerochaeta sp.]